MSTMPLPPEYQVGLQYGPDVQANIRRSRYLTEALQAMRQSGENIRSPGELGMRLLATAITKYSKDKTDKAAMSSLQAEREAYARSLVEGLRGWGQPPTTEAPAAPAAAAPGPMPEPPTVATVPPPAMVDVKPLEPAKRRLSSEEARALAAEILPGVKFTSGYRTPERNAAVGGVSNSYHTRGDGQAWDMVPPPGADLEKFRADLTARGVPVTELLHEDKGGRNEHWHWAFGGDGAPAAAPEASMQYAALAPQQGAPPMGAPPMSAPAGPPAMSGPAPGPQPPQAAPGATTMQATQQQLALVEQLLANPRTYDQGVAYAMKLRQELAQPLKWESVTINNAPFERNPYTGEVRPIPLPPGVQTQVLPAQEAGIPTAPQGTYVQRDPLGNIKDVPGGPPQGYGVQGDGYSPIRGGPADPYRPQAPATGYEYRGGVQQPIQGGPADPRNPQAILAGTESIRREIAPVIDLQQKLDRNIAGVRVGVAQNNGAGDIAAINGLQRLIDEGVVREGDVALQLRGQGIAGGIAGLKGYITSEGFFADPSIRQKIAKVADELHADISAGYRARVLGYKPIVENAYGPGTFEKFVLTPDVVNTLGWTPQGKAQPPPPDPATVAGTAPAGSMDAAIAEAIKRGLPLSPQMQKRARELGLIR